MSLPTLPTGVLPATIPSASTLLPFGVAIFAGLFVAEWLPYFLLTAIKGTDPTGVLFPKRNRDILSRRLLEGVVMSALGVVGLLIQDEQGWSNSDMAGRPFTYNPWTTALVFFQAAYQCFNMLTSIRDNDGIVFIVHHIATASLCVLTLKPFMQPWCPYFLGVSEVSTAPLCFLACYDERWGVPDLSRRLPKTKMLLGVVFAALFVACRIFGWFYYSYGFWQDMLALFPSQGGTDPLTFFFVQGDFFPILIFVLTVNVGLSILQVVWLGEIVVTAHQELLGSGGPSAAIDGEKKKQKKKQ